MNEKRMCPENMLKMVKVTQKHRSKVQKVIAKV